MLAILEKYGGWPVVEGSDWNTDDSWNWLEINKKMFDDGLLEALILAVTVETDSKNSSKRILIVGKLDDCAIIVLTISQ